MLVHSSIYTLHSTDIILARTLLQPTEIHLHSAPHQGSLAAVLQTPAESRKIEMSLKTQLGGCYMPGISSMR